MSKRRAERQITDRDRSEDEEDLEVFTGPGAIQVAPAEVLAERRIVKGRRGGKKPVEPEPQQPEKPVSTEPSVFNFEMKPSDDKQPVFNFTMLKPDEKPSFNFASDTSSFSFTPKASSAESPSKVLFSFSESSEPKQFSFKPPTPEKTEKPAEKSEEKPKETQPETPQEPTKTEKTPEKSTPEKTAEKPAESAESAEKPTEKEPEKTPEKVTPTPASWSSSFAVPSTEPSKFSFITPVWPTFDTPFKTDSANPFGSISPFPSLGSFGTTPASPFGAISSTPSKLGVWGKDIAQPSAPEEQFNASVPSSPSQKIEKQAETKTGEEDEEVVFKAKAKLFEFEKDAASGSWKERGIGEIKVNTNKATKRSRIVMRMDSTLRLMLNVPIISGMVVEQPNPKNVRFIAMHSINDGVPVTASFVVRLADGDGLARAINNCKAAREENKD